MNQHRTTVCVETVEASAAAWCRWASGDSTPPTALASVTLAEAMMQQYGPDALGALAGYPPFPLGQWLCRSLPTLRRLVETERRMRTAASCMLMSHDVLTLADFDVEMRRVVGTPAGYAARQRHGANPSEPPPFEALGLGPLLCQPIVLSQFGATVAALARAGMATPYAISALDVIEGLLRFSEEQRGAVDHGAFLEWLAQERSVANVALLGVRITSLTAHQRTVGHFLANRRQMVRQLQTNLASSNWKRYCAIEKDATLELAKLECALKERVQASARAQLARVAVHEKAAAAGGGDGAGAAEEDSSSTSSSCSSSCGEEEEDDGGAARRSNGGHAASAQGSKNRVGTAGGETAAVAVAARATAPAAAPAVERRAAPIAILDVAPSALRAFARQCVRARVDNDVDAAAEEAQLLRQFNTPQISACRVLRSVTARDFRRLCASLERGAALRQQVHFDGIFFLHALGEPARVETLDALRTSARGAPGVDASLSAAVRSLRSAPPLADLAVWTQWRAVFEPVHGPLDEFLFHGHIGLTHAAAEDPFALAVAPGTLLSLRDAGVPTASCAEHLGAMLRARDARRAAAALTLAHVRAASVQCVPYALLRAESSAAFISLLAKASSAEEREACGTMALACLAHLPRALQLLAVGVVIMPAFAHALCATKLESPAEWTQVRRLHALFLRSAECAGCDEALNQHTAMLHEAGVAFGVALWRENFARRCISAEVASPPCLSPAAARGAGAGIAGNAPAAPAGIPSAAAAQVDRFGVYSDVTGEGASSPIAPNALVATHSAVRQQHLLHTPTAAPRGNAAALSQCRALVESIRRDEFGIGLLRSRAAVGGGGGGAALSASDAVYNRLVHSQQSRLGRALQRLSQELYTEDSHFLLELLQNADDNRYDASTVPTLSIELGRRGGGDATGGGGGAEDMLELRLFNNESGFRAEDVRALCDVGASTKAKANGLAAKGGGAKGGAIGEKGIGFKSVFRVCAAPEIHSRSTASAAAFHFRFCAKGEKGGNVNPLGMIVPHWCAEHPRWKNAFGGGDGTLIALPLDGMDRSGGGAATAAASATALAPLRIESHLKALQPYLLLFLRRIRRLTLQNDVEKSAETFQRCDSGDALTEEGMLLTIDAVRGGGTGPDGVRRQRWLVVSATPTCPPALEGLIGLASGESATITVALPLDALDGDVGPMPTVPVFAFLPVRDYGLRFAVHAPWALPSSREAVDASSVRNQWLRGHLAPLVLRGWNALRLRLDAAAQRRTSDGAPIPVPAWLLRGAARMWSLLPGPGAVQGFFRPFARELIAAVATSTSATVPGLRPTVGGRWRRTLLPLSQAVCLPQWLQHRNRTLCRRVFDPALLHAIGATVGIVAPKHALSAAEEGRGGGGATGSGGHPWDSASLLPSRVRAAVGMRNLGVDDVIALLQRWVRHRTAAETEVEVEGPAPTAAGRYEGDTMCWLAAACATIQLLYERREDHGDGGSATLAMLRGLRFLPLTNGTMTSLDEGSVFFPPRHSAAPLNPPPDVRCLHSALGTTREGEFDDNSSAVRRLMRRLGVGTLCAKDVVRDVIFPLYRDAAQWSTCTETMLVWALRFLNDHFAALAAAGDREGDVAFLRALYTTRPVVLTTHRGCDAEERARLQCTRFVVGGFAPLRNGTSRHSAAVDIDVLLKRGDDDNEHREEDTAHVHSDALASILTASDLCSAVTYLDERHMVAARVCGELCVSVSPFVAVYRVAQRNAAGARIDWVSPEFARVAAALSSRGEDANVDSSVAAAHINFACELVRRWKDSYGLCAHAVSVVTARSGTCEVQVIGPSSFARSVQRSRWIPSAPVTLRLKGKKKGSGTQRLAAPSGFVVAAAGSREMEALKTALGPFACLVLPEARVLATLRVLDAVVPPEADSNEKSCDMGSHGMEGRALDFLGFKRELDLPLALDILQLALGALERGDVAPAELKGLFTFVHQRSMRASVAERGHIAKALSAGARPVAIFASVWCDATGVRDAFNKGARAACPVPPSISDVYGAALKSFFVNVLEVPVEPTFVQYCAAVEALIAEQRRSAQRLSEEHRRKSACTANGAIASVFRHWANGCTDSVCDSGGSAARVRAWLKRKATGAVLPSAILGEYVSMESEPLAVVSAAESAMAARFADAACSATLLDVSFCRAASHAFLEQCGICSLSSRIELDVEAEGARVDIALAWIVQRVLCVAQRAIAARYPSVYAALHVEGGVGAQLVRQRHGQGKEGREQKGGRTRRSGGDATMSLGGLLCYSAERVSVTPRLTGATGMSGTTVRSKAVFYVHEVPRFVVHVRATSPPPSRTPWVQAHVAAGAPPLWGRFDLNELCGALASALCPTDGAEDGMRDSLSAVLRCASIDMMTIDLEAEHAAAQRTHDGRGLDAGGTYHAVLCSVDSTPDAWIDTNLPSLAARYPRDTRRGALWEVHGLVECCASRIASAAASAAAAAAASAEGGDIASTVLEGWYSGAVALSIAAPSAPQSTSIEATSSKRDAPWEVEADAARERACVAKRPRIERAHDVEASSGEAPTSSHVQRQPQVRRWSALVGAPPRAAGSSGVGALEKRARTGREGEAVVHQYLRQKCAQLQAENSHSGAHVVWVNEKAEVGDAWDLILFEGGRKTYVEVKATIKRHEVGREDAFDISPAEVQAAARLQDRYHIYRVHFGDGEARIECIPDPLALLRQSQLRLCIVLPPKKQTL